MIRRLMAFLMVVGLLAMGCKKGQAPTKSNQKAAKKSTEKAAKKQAAVKAGLEAPAKFQGTVAVVNGENLDAKLLNDELDRLTQNGKRKLPHDRLVRVERSVLKRLIDDMLIAQEAKRQGIEVTKEELDKAFEEYKGRFASPKQFETYLKRARMNKAMIDKWLKKKLTLEKLLDKQGALKVTEDEAKKVYENNIRLYTDPERVRVQGILIKVAQDASKADLAKAQQKAKVALAALAKGTEFAAVAKKFSEDTTKDNGGNMGWVRRDMLPKVLEDAVFGLKPGTYTKQAVRGPKGLYIFKSLEKKEKKVRPFDEVKDKILKSLRNRKVFRARLNLVKELRAKAKIEIKAAELKEPAKKAKK
jgi:parvulin-like peptidyl-prolyl isomerase